MGLFTSLKSRIFANHTGLRATRALAIFLLTAAASSLPYASATVNPNNFSISFGLSDTSDPDYSIGTQYYCMPRYNDSSGTYAQM